VVRPKTSDADSNESKVIGTLVLTKGTAPASRRSRTSAESFSAGFPTQAEYPIQPSQPWTPTVFCVEYSIKNLVHTKKAKPTSLRLTGTPARGPVRWQSLAHPTASAIMTSVKQFVSLWAWSAFLPYAVKISIGSCWPSCTWETKVDKGKLITSWSLALMGSWNIGASALMFSWRSCCFSLLENDWDNFSEKPIYIYHK